MLVQRLENRTISGQIFLEQDLAESHDPIFATEEGMKIIVSVVNEDGISPGTMEVYGLCGDLEINVGYEEAITEKSYPNPSNTVLNIPYVLPKNENNGKIRLYNQAGQLIKAMVVDNNFSELKINTADLPSGKYFYTIETSGKTIQTKQVLVIH
jgi:hypothetical protein